MEINANNRDDARRQILAAITALGAEYDRLDSLPEEPIYEDGSGLIFFTKQFSPFGVMYTYSAVRAARNGRWYVTGGSSFASRREGYTWDALLQWIMMGTHYKIYTATAFDLIMETID